MQHIISVSHYHNINKFDVVDVESRDGESEGEVCCFTTFIQDSMLVVATKGDGRQCQSIIFRAFASLMEMSEAAGLDSGTEMERSTPGSIDLVYTMLMEVEQWSGVWRDVVLVRWSFRASARRLFD